MHQIGVISDTHGLLRPQATAALAGCDWIIHAGDVGDPEILAHLARIAPLTAVRGNIDGAAWAARLPEREIVPVDGLRILVLHDIGTLDIDPSGEGLAAVVCGHSHRPRNEQVGGVLYFNPGSAGPRRFTLPITVGRLTVADGALRGEIIALSV
jgi:putative phosphoesterase